MRKLSGMLLIIVLALVMVACGEEEEDTENPELEATPPVSSSPIDVDATVDAAGIATPSSLGTPPVEATPGVIASPIVAASPAASPVGATPEAGNAAVVAPVGEVVSLSGTVIVEGTENEAFILTDSGCVGLGEHSDLRDGRQVVVRDKTGAIIGVTALQSSQDGDSCTWEFGLDVPESAFYSVSIPMVTEYVFTHDDVEQDGGEIAISLD